MILHQVKCSLRKEPNAEAISMRTEFGQCQTESNGDNEQYVHLPTTLSALWAQDKHSDDLGEGRGAFDTYKTSLEL
jgi:hypothetical protein